MEVIEMEELLKVVVTEGLKLVDAKYGTIYLSNKKVLERVYSTIPQDLRVKIQKTGFTYQAFKQKKFTLIASADVPAVQRENKDNDVKSLVVVPLCHRSSCIGVLSFDSNKNAFTDQEIKMLTLYGAMATLALKQALTYQETHKAVEVRDLFISLTAHEFRTPLTTINGYAQLLRRKLTQDNSALSQWTDELNTEVKRLIEMTNELLEISRIKSGKIDYTYKETNVLDIVSAAANRFRFSYPLHKLQEEIELETNFQIIGDADKLLQVFTNILENAGKFSPMDKPVSIKVTQKDKWIVIAITDMGRGIAKEDQERIFQGFYKGLNTDESQGMGLGLYIAKSIVDAHQGRLRVSSKINKGTTFSVYLPTKAY